VRVWARDAIWGAAPHALSLSHTHTHTHTHKQQKRGRGYPSPWVLGGVERSVEPLVERLVEYIQRRSGASTWTWRERVE
jgi:hypothetical protein